VLQRPLPMLTHFFLFLCLYPWPMGQRTVQPFFEMTLTLLVWLQENNLVIFLQKLTKV
jgi:hypothetical protein